MLNKDQMKIGGRYNWKNQPERLIYTGTARYGGDIRTWHQFAKVENPNVCWCEVLTSDLEMFEETTDAIVVTGAIELNNDAKIVKEKFDEFCYDFSPYIETGKRKAQWKQEICGRKR